MGPGLARIRLPCDHSVLYSEFDELEIELKVSVCLGPGAEMELNVE